jgi:hypothetical protein
MQLARRHGIMKTHQGNRMFNIFTNLMLMGCSDTGLNALPDEPAPETNECGCPDYSDKIAELETRINGLTDQLEHVQGDMLDNDARISDIEEASTSSSSLIVSEYMVDCVADREDPATEPDWLRGYQFSNYTGESNSYGCLVANIDITDRPYSMEITWLTDNTLTYPTYSRELSIEMYGSDRPELFVWYTNWGNDLRYVPTTVSALAAGFGTYITSSGDVYANITSWQTNWSAAPEELPIKAIPVRVVIIHDRSYTLPTYTP